MKKITGFSVVFFTIIFVLKASAFAQNAAITFQAHVKCHTPEGEDICVYIENLEGVPTGDPTTYKMDKIGENLWEFTVSSQWFSVGQTLRYKYCRNLNSGGADESFDNNNLQGMREIKINQSNTIVHDTIIKWRWWPVDGVVPEADVSTHLSSPPSNLQDSSYIFGVMMPDFWQKNFGPYVEPTFNKIVKNTNSMWLEYSPVPEIKQFYPTPIIVKEGINGTPESDLVKIISEAHKRGLRVYLNPFPWTFTTDNSPNYHTNDWWKAFQKEWGNIVLYYAQIAQEYQVEMLGFRMWPNIWNISEQEIPVIDSLSTRLMEQVRNVYKGKICVEFNPWSKDMQIYSQGDYLSFFVWSHWPWALSNSDQPEVSEMVSNLSANLDNNIAASVAKWGKPLILSQIACPSYVGGTHTSYPEEQTDPFFPDNPEYQIDLQVQADMYEAMLNVFTQKDWIAGSFAFIYGFYWDEIAKDYSIRAKPAEKVVAKWFRWLAPEKRHISISCTEGGTTDPIPAAYLKSKEDIVSVTAIPDQGYHFVKWTGDIDSNTNPISIKLDSDKEITAVFAPNLTSVQEQKILKRLTQNYPNPFNKNTIIKYHLPTSGLVTINVYNSSGALVKSLVNTLQQKGDYSTSFSAEGLADGTYYYTLTINNILYDRQKMVLAQ